MPTARAPEHEKPVFVARDIHHERAETLSDFTSTLRLPAGLSLRVEDRPEGSASDVSSLSLRNL